MANVVCFRCGKLTHEIIDDYGDTWLQANCSWCGGYLRAVPRPVTPATTVLTFGKHKGRALKDIPLPYLRWLHDNASGNMKPDMKANLVKYLGVHDAS